MKETFLQRTTDVSLHKISWCFSGTYFETFEFYSNEGLQLYDYSGNVPKCLVFVFISADHGNCHRLTITRVLR